MAQLSVPPNSPPFLEGILNWRGESIPVVRVTRLFEWPDSPLQRFTPLLLLDKEPLKRVALLVDRTRTILEVSPDQMSESPRDHSLKECIVSAFQWSGETVFALSPENLLLKEELLRIEHFKGEEHRRITQAKA